MNYHATKPLILGVLLGLALFLISLTLKRVDLQSTTIRVHLRNVLSAELIRQASMNAVGPLPHMKPMLTVQAIPLLHWMASSGRNRRYVNLDNCR